MVNHTIEAEMTSMTETPFYFVTPPAMLPEDVKKASERMMNLWMGAMSPLWAPFWVASSFGVGMWALARNVKPAEGLMDDMKSDAWLGLFRSWGLEAGELHEKAVEAVEDASRSTVATEEAATEKATNATIESAGPVMDGMAAASDIAAEIAGSLKETPAEVVTAAAPVEPKPIARSVAAERKARSKPSA